MVDVPTVLLVVILSVLISATFAFPGILSFYRAGATEKKERARQDTVDQTTAKLYKRIVDLEAEQVHLQQKAERVPLLENEINSLRQENYLLLGKIKRLESAIAEANERLTRLGSNPI